MTSKQQFEALWNVGYKRGILAIIQNKGRALPKTKLKSLLETALRDGLVARVLVLAGLAGITLKTRQVDGLVNRCLQREWLPDALSAARIGGASEITLKKLTRMCIRKELADTPEEVAELLRSE